MKKSPKRAHKTRAYKVKVLSGETVNVSAFERNATQAFRRAVQKEFAVLAKRRIPTVVVVDGETIRGVPRKIRGRYVVSKS